MKRGRDGDVVKALGHTRQKKLTMCDIINNKWINKCIMVDGEEFIVDAQECERLLCFDNELVIDGNHWYPIATTKDAMLYIDETGEYFKRVCYNSGNA